MLGSINFFFIFISLLAFVLLALSVLLGRHIPYSEKESAFECGFHSFRGQNRKEFNISFFIFGLLFLLFDLEILLVYPYVVSAYNNSFFGLAFLIVFLLLLTAGFVFEYGKGALTIESKQTTYIANDTFIINVKEISDKFFLSIPRIVYPTNLEENTQFKRDYSNLSRAKSGILLLWNNIQFVLERNLEYYYSEFYSICTRGKSGILLLWNKMGLAVNKIKGG